MIDSALKASCGGILSLDVVKYFIFLHNGIFHEFSLILLNVR